jgi:hypothetical protein
MACIAVAYAAGSFAGGVAGGAVGSPTGPGAGVAAYKGAIAGAKYVGGGLSAIACFTFVGSSLARVIYVVGWTAC